MRLFGLLVLVVIPAFAMPQTSRELHRKYGEPDIERFIARPGIGLTVQYGPDRQACEAIIEAPRQAGNEMPDAAPMDQAAANEVLEEIAPTAMRGNQTNDSIFQASCGAAHFTQYDNVSITRGFSACWLGKSKEEQDGQITVTFKRDVCPTPKNQPSAAQR